jgi:hypothetical protein
MSHPNDDAKHLLKGGLGKALETARERLLTADSGDDEMSQVHALLVLTYLQGYANGKGFSAVMTPAQYVRMHLDAHPLADVLANCRIKRKQAVCDEEYAFYNHAIEILEGS